MVEKRASTARGYSANDRIWIRLGNQWWWCSSILIDWKALQEMKQSKESCRHK